MPRRALTSTKNLIADASELIASLTPEQLGDELQRDRVVLIDLREHAERELSGAIPGAVHVPAGMLVFCADPALPVHAKELDRSRRIVLYCSSGSRSALAALMLKAMGYPDVANLDGGFESWRNADYTVKPPPQGGPT